MAGPKASGRSTAVVLWLMITLVFLPIVAVHGIASVIVAREVAAREQEALQQTASAGQVAPERTGLILHR
jgi:hypothetical protein